VREKAHYKISGVIQNTPPMPVGFLPKIQQAFLLCAQDMGIVINPEGTAIQMEGCVTIGGVPANAIHLIYAPDSGVPPIRATKPCVCKPVAEGVPAICAR
jgi:hypothetical protein